MLTLEGWLNINGFGWAWCHYVPRRKALRHLIEFNEVGIVSNSFLLCLVRLVDFNIFMFYVHLFAAVGMELLLRLVFGDPSW